MSPKMLGVHIKCRDLKKSQRFYNALGFKPIFAYGSDLHLSRFTGIPTASEKYNGVVYSIGEALLEIADGHIAVKSEVFEGVVGSSKISLMVDVDSVEKVREIAITESLEIAAETREFHWGSREIVLRDPDGVIVVFREMINPID